MNLDAKLIHATCIIVIIAATVQTGLNLLGFLYGFVMGASSGVGM